MRKGASAAAGRLAFKGQPQGCVQREKDGCKGMRTGTLMLIHSLLGVESYVRS